MQAVIPEELYNWCKIPVDKLENNSSAKIPYRICKDSF